MTAAGGVLRHQGVNAAWGGHKNVPGFEILHPRKWAKTYPAGRLLRAGAAGRRRYLAGAAAGLAGTPAVAVGGYQLLTSNKRVVKADKRKPSFLREGAAGATDALGQRVASARETPPQAKAIPTGIGLAAGGVGSLAAHRTLDRIGAFQHGRLHTGRAGITAAAGTLAGAASFPLARHAMANNREYEVTPAGVRRRKNAPVKPSKRARVINARDRSLRTRQAIVPSTNVGKADYLGRRTPGYQQRTATYAAGTAPLVGGLAAAHVAGSFAPPGQKRRAATRQFVGGPVTGFAGGVGGAYGMAHLADKYKSVQDAADRAAAAHAKAKSKLPNLPKLGKLKRGGEMKAKAVSRVEGARVLGPLRRRPIAAGVGFFAGRVLAGQTGGTIAMNRNLAAQRRYNAKHPVEKLAGDPAPLRTKRQQAQQLRSKQRAVATGALATVAGLAGTGLLVARHTPRLSALQGSKLERAAIHTSVVGGGIGAVNGIQNQRIARRDLKQQRHDLGVHKAWPQVRRAPAGLGRRRSYARSGFRHSSGGRLVRVKAGLR